VVWPARMWSMLVLTPNARLKRLSLSSLAEPYLIFSYIWFTGTESIILVSLAQ
jgi:hypothetical protein